LIVQISTHIGDDEAPHTNGTAAHHPVSTTHFSPHKIAYLRRFIH